MPLFVRSVELNPSIQVFLISTNAVRRLPANITHIPWSLSDIERRVREFIDPSLSVPHAYKLCDFRPFFGMLFPDLVRDFDFWGYCDLDLVFGNLSRLLTDDRLADTDVFFADAHMVVGHFALYRNCPIVNALGKRLPNYISLLASSDHMSCDELGMSQVLAANPEIRWSMARSLSESQFTIKANGKMMGQTSGVLGSRHRIYWRNGSAFIKSREYGQQEVLYLHFMGLKRGYHWVTYDPNRVYEEFSLSANGFVPWVDPPSNWHYWKIATRGGAMYLVSSARGMAAKIVPNKTRLRIKEMLRGYAARRLTGSTK